MNKSLIVILEREKLPEKFHKFNLRRQIHQKLFLSLKLINRFKHKTQKSVFYQKKENEGKLVFLKLIFHCVHFGLTN